MDRLRGPEPTPAELDLTMAVGLALATRPSWTESELEAARRVLAVLRRSDAPEAIVLENELNRGFAHEIQSLKRAKRAERKATLWHSIGDK